MYRAPVDEITHTLHNLTGLGAALAQEKMGDLSADLVDAILEEAGKFASEEIAPLSKIGDEQGTPLKDGAVTMPDGWKDLYRRWCESGWNALTGPEEFGGQALPTSLSVATFEMWNSGSLAFGIGPTLTVGAIEAVEKHASAELQKLYLGKLVSGEWTGTMNLTEPQAGSDLNALKAKAIPTGDGSYRVFGQKIFITFGEHDLTDNIIHLVLARLPDAPAGTRGLSLFLVPKFLLNEDGAPGKRNDVFCSSLEHKMGIHASPTCTMIFGDGIAGDEPGAVGWLVGEENKGLACMFTMMNNARLLVGIQGVAVGEAAFQHANAYAHERRQGRSSSHSGDAMSPIVEHPDVQRNLLTMKSLTSAARAICYNCAHAIDMGRLGGDGASFWQNRAHLLTPIAKAFSTDIGTDVASIGIQIHGGMGFIEETGAAQYFRDSRIAQIYEGTNGIQAMDLVLRKLPLEGGEVMAAYMGELREIVEEARGSNQPGIAALAEPLTGALDDLQTATDWLMDTMANGSRDAVLAGATPFARLFALAAGGCYLAKSALVSPEGNDQGRSGLAGFYCNNLLGETTHLKSAVTGGAEALLGAIDALRPS